MRKSRLHLLAAGLLLLVKAAYGAQPASLKLPSVISDNMVLQAEKPARVWGWAQPGQKVSVKIAGQEKSALAAADGGWSVFLDPLKAGTEATMTIVADKTLTVKDILVGEVWMCGGQSNMEIKLPSAANAQAELKAANFPAIRVFTTRMAAPDKPAQDAAGKWEVCSPQTDGNFSAVAFYFGRKLHSELKAPVGLVVSSHGGTPAENWLSYEALKAEPSLQPIVERHDNMAKDTKGWDPQLPTGLFNGKVAPLGKMTVRGILWYQGESNSSRAYQYRTLFPAVIKDWRKTFGEELPFYFVQLANFQAPPKEPPDEPWAELREAQTMALSLPNTGMAVTIDIGDAANIHPTNKRDVGDRLVRLALAKTYGRDVPYAGPMYKEMKAENGKIRLTFDHVNGGLLAKGGALKRFAIAGEDKKFVWADAAIEGETVVVSSSKVATPVAVRYAWANNPEGCNLYNKAGLPASPFRTDDWLGVTANATGKPIEKFVPRPRQAPASDALTGNTIEVKLGDTIDRRWDDVKSEDYLYGPRQDVLPTRETRLFLPYGTAKGAYFEVSGVKLTDPEPGTSPAIVSEDPAKPGHVTLKFHFDKPIKAFRFNANRNDWNLTNAEGGLEYSVDGKTWVAIQTVTASANANKLVDAGKFKAANLNTRDLYIRCFARSKASGATAWMKVYTGGDLAWGDASTTFFANQWQLILAPAE